jgi:hypothetical protein
MEKGARVLQKKVKILQKKTCKTEVFAKMLLNTQAF